MRVVERRFELQMKVSDVIDSKRQMKAMLGFTRRRARPHVKKAVSAIEFEIKILISGSLHFFAVTVVFNISA